MAALLAVAKAGSYVDVRRLRNSSGGFDYEIRVPWDVLDLAAPDVAGGEASLTLVVAGRNKRSEWWSWPSPFPYLPRFLGRPALEKTD